MASSDEALYIWCGPGHSKTNVSANIETFSGFSFGGHLSREPRFAKIRSVDCYREASLGIQLRPFLCPPAKASWPPVGYNGPLVEKA